METLALVLRLVIALLFFATFVLFVLTMGYGRAYVEARRRREEAALLWRTLATHHSLARWVLRLTLVAVALTETYAWVHGRPLPHNWLFWLHLGTSCAYLAGTWQLTHRWSGLEEPAFHKQRAYATVAAFCVALLTGYVRLFYELTRQLGLGWLLQ